MGVLSVPAAWVTADASADVEPAEDAWWDAEREAWAQQAPLQYMGLALQQDVLYASTEDGGSSPWRGSVFPGPEGGAATWNNGTKVLTGSGTAGLFRGALRPGSVRVFDVNNGYTLLRDDGQGSLFSELPGVTVNSGTVDYETGEVAFDATLVFEDHPNAEFWPRISADFFYDAPPAEALPQLLPVYWDRPDFADFEGAPVTLFYIIDGQETTVEVPWEAARYGTYSISIPPGTQQFSLTVYGYVFCSTELMYWRGTPFSDGPPVGEDCEDITGFNCECVCGNPDNLTLAEYRTRLMQRLGFAANAANPPPGMAALLTTFLQDAQDFIYRKYPALETRWFFRWTLEQGVRYYGIRANDGLEGDCSIYMDPYKNIEGAWLIDLNGMWIPLVCGIPPTFYTTVNNTGLPMRYEIRQCVEVFPAPPAAGYQLFIKGHLKKQRFSEDTDKPTIDGQLVYLWALANALDYYGKPSAAGVAEQAREHLGSLVAGTHTGKRYLPGTRPLPPAVMPVFVPYTGP